MYASYKQVQIKFHSARLARAIHVVSPSFIHHRRLSVIQ